MTAEELRALVTSTPVGFAVVEAGLPGVDRSLVADVREAGTALAVVGGPGLAAAVERLEADVVLPNDFAADDLAAALRAHARSEERRTATPSEAPDLVPRAEVIAVTGPPGAGASTLAQALATALAGRGPTLLADLALDADQHLRHGVPPGTDGVFELAEALRHAPPDEVTPTVAPQGPGYDLVCGLRRRQEWVVLGAAVAEQVVDVLRRAHRHLVADVSPELEGRAETGSLDVEDRNALARAVVGHASAVVVVGRGTTTGLPRLVRLCAELDHHGIDRRRVRPVLNGAPRRTAATRATADLLDDLVGDGWPPAVTLPHDRRVERRLREAAPLPRRFVDRATAALVPA